MLDQSCRTATQSKTQMSSMKGSGMIGRRLILMIKVTRLLIPMDDHVGGFQV